MSRRPSDFVGEHFYILLYFEHNFFLGTICFQDYAKRVLLVKNRTMLVRFFYIRYENHSISAVCKAPHLNCMLQFPTKG